MASDFLQPQSQEDWEVTVTGEGRERSYQLSASCVSSPQRYQLLALILLLFTLIVPQIITFILGLWIAGWSSRRFILIVSSMHGIELIQTMIVPYRRVRLPLLSTQLKRIELDNKHEHITTDRQSKLTRSAKLIRPTELVLSHPNLHTGPIFLMKADQQLAESMCQRFSAWVHESHRIRTMFAREPLELYKSEPGEWIIALIELFPSLLAPRRDITVIRTKLSFWSPHLSSAILALIFFCIGLGVILVSAGLSLMMILAAVFTLLSDREYIWIGHHELVWRRKVLGITITERLLSTNISTELERDLHAPSGRRLHLVDSVKGSELLSLGHSWDAAWLYREINRGVSQHRTLGHRD